MKASRILQNVTAAISAKTGNGCCARLVVKPDIDRQRHSDWRDGKIMLSRETQLCLTSRNGGRVIVVQEPRLPAGRAETYHDLGTRTDCAIPGVVQQ